MFFPDVIGQHNTQQHLLDLVANNRLSHALLLVGKEGSGLLPLAVNFGQYVVSISAQPAPASSPANQFGNIHLFADDATTAATPLTHHPIAEGRKMAGIDPLAAQLQHPDLHFSYPTVNTKKKKTSIEKSFIANDDEKEKGTLAVDFFPEFREFYTKFPFGSGTDWIEFIKETPNQQGKITKLECDDIIRKLSLKPFSARYKVLVMWMPELLKGEGNRLLKLIEEPPEDTLFILVTSDEDNVLPTIASRCQEIRVPPLSEEDIEQALISRCGADPDTARQLSIVCEGNYHEAQQLLQHNEDDLNGLLRDWLNAALLKGSKAFERFDLQSKFVTTVSQLGRERQKQLLRYFIQLIEQSLRVRLIGEDRLHLPASEKDFALRLNKFSGLGQQKAMAEELETAIYYIERNANAKMLFHALTLKLRAIVLEKTIIVA